MKKIVLSLFLSLGFIAFPAWAQTSTKPTSQTRKPTVINYGNGVGGVVNLNNSGFGGTFFVLKSINKEASLILEASIKSEHDENEEKVYDYFGNSYIFNKYNYMLAIPARVGIQKRLFADEIEDSFRPYFQATVGPTLAWLSPYFNDANGNNTWDCTQTFCEKTYDAIGSIPKGKGQLGMGGSLAIGAGFGKSRKTMQAIQIGYNFDVYSKEVQLMEPGFQKGAKFFGSPTIGIVFGRLR